MTAALALATPLLAAAAKKPSGSPVFLIVLIAGVGFYFFYYLPKQRKARALREEPKGYDVGDEVLTAGGIVGHIIDIEGDRVTLETSVGASFVVLRQYVLRKLEEPQPDEDVEDEEGEEYDEEPAALDDGSALDDDAEEDGAGGAASTEEHPAGHGGTKPNGDDKHDPDSPSTA